MHKKYHEKFKILDILAVTTQAHEGIETQILGRLSGSAEVTTQAHEGIETTKKGENIMLNVVTTQAHEGIETHNREAVRAEYQRVTTQAHEGIETLQTCLFLL